MPRSHRTQPIKPLDRAVRESSLRRREEHRDQLRVSIFRAAAELLVEEGYAAFSLRRLATRIGYSATTIYRYYRDKDDLVLAVLDEGFRIFGERLSAAAASERDPLERLCALGRAYVGFGREHPVYYRVMFMERADIWGTMPEESRASKLATFAILQRSVEAAIASGRSRFRPEQAEAVSLAMWAGVHGVTSLLLTMEFEPAHREAMIDRALDLQQSGFTTR
jgi:AcrR family transcriptional regulator